ncbi:MAG: nicotinate phosphoribosyltransferase [Dehalococcoidales bacterium]|nr:nicotinate phosphoribosyltransferase [Dehalococcoidales bacterium]MDX9986085.1 nicotinate phosphoribosyltransferase [Dehalococcoidales bacterium]
MSGLPSRDILNGNTADVYFKRTIDILKAEGLNPTVIMEVFPNRKGVLCGIKEALGLLKAVLPCSQSEVWAMPEGEVMENKEIVLRIKAPYQSFGLYETALCGVLAHGCGWATAARECVEAAGDIPVISFGARHVHPNVAGVMDYAAIVGGCKACSSISGADMTGTIPSGTMPHSLILIMGDTVEAALAFDRHMPESIGRVALVDTFKDEAEESLRVAEALGRRLASIRLDTPVERGRVTVELVKEVRARLDLAGYDYVKIFVSGGLDAERIKLFISSGAPVDGFGVGSYISGARPIDFTADLHEIDGQPIAKRGRIPGITPNPRLVRII